MFSRCDPGTSGVCLLSAGLQLAPPEAFLVHFGDELGTWNLRPLQFPTITSLLRQRITQVVVRLCTEHAGKCLFVVSVFTLGPCD